jgi:hypothetical protein
LVTHFDEAVTALALAVAVITLELRPFRGPEG